MKSAPSNRIADLRKRAEARLDLEAEARRIWSQDEVQELVHELQTHQVELEVQNEELLRAQEELLESRDQYFHFYQTAPLGYVTVSHQGIVL